MCQAFVESTESCVLARQSHVRKQAEAITRDDSGRLRKHSLLGAAFLGHSCGYFLHGEDAVRLHTTRHVLAGGHPGPDSRRLSCLFSL